MHGINIKSGVNLLLHEVNWKSRLHVRANPMREILLLIARDNPNVDIGADVSVGELADGQRAM